MELLYFFKPGCPYCAQADGIIKELILEHPEYESVQFRRIDETTDPIVDNYDYWYVPCLWYDDQKRYEANPSDSAETVKDKLNKVFESILNK